MTLAELVRKMVDAGATPELIALAVEAVDGALSRKSNSARSERNRRYYQKRLIKTSETSYSDVLEASDSVLIASEKASENPPPRVSAPAPVLYGEENSIITPLEPTVLIPTTVEPKTSVPAKQKKQTPRESLAEAVGDDLAAEVVEHRQRMRKPLTLGGASRLAKQFVSTGAPQDAARMMIDRAWQGFSAEWFENARAGPNGGQRTHGNNSTRNANNGKSTSAADYAREFANDCDAEARLDFGLPPLLEGDGF